jgi:hypothetical protein|tara:strand:- start:820 stop:1467 length:648 start_codon:yes stop_codon:yes gene_type:complete
MPYFGNQLARSFSAVSYQDLTGGSGTGFTLDHAVANANEVEVFVNNVRQEPNVAYTVSGTTMTMTGSVASTDDFYVVFQSKAQQSITLPANITSPTTFGGGVTFNKAMQGNTQTTSVSGDTTLDFDTFQNFIITLGASINLANPTTDADNGGQTGFIIFIQDSSGNRSVSPASDYITPANAALTLSSTANAVDLVPYAIQTDNKILLGTPQLAFS